MKDLTGQMFGRLTVIDFDRKEGNKYYWLCKCDCESKKIKSILSGHIKSGKTQSCGCLQKEKVTKHGMWQHRFYNIWKGIKTRCNNSNDTGYGDYGGRGISVDPKWNDFLEFKKDMWIKWLNAKAKYRKERNDKNSLSIERKDVNGNYTKENCIFIPLNDQQKNTRKNKWFKATNLKTKEEVVMNNQHEFSRQYNLDASAISGCLNQPQKRKQHKGWAFNYLSENKNTYKSKIIQKG